MIKIIHYFATISVANYLNKRVVFHLEILLSGILLLTFLNTAFTFSEGIVNNNLYAYCMENSSSSVDKDNPGVITVLLNYYNKGININLSELKLKYILQIGVIAKCTVSAIKYNPAPLKVPAVISIGSILTTAAWGLRMLKKDRPIIETTQSNIYPEKKHVKIIVEASEPSILSEMDRDMTFQSFNIHAALENEEFVTDLLNLSLIVVFFVVLAFFAISLAIFLFVLSNVNSDSKFTNYRLISYILRIAKIYGKVNGTIWMSVGLLSLAFGCYFSYHLSDLINYLK